jgi:ribosomal protein L12E/L44/L45/RPP1/RPP2
LQDNEEVTVTEDKINAIIKATGVSVEPFWPMSTLEASSAM